MPFGNVLYDFDETLYGGRPFYSEFTSEVQLRNFGPIMSAVGVYT